MKESPLAVAQSKSELVHDYLREQILSGALAPGERLRMDALARDLQVSKIPIREAVQRLASDGLVTQQAHVGPTVAVIDSHELKGVYLTRLAVEPLAARLAAETITEKQLLVLEQTQLDMRQALLNGDLARLSALNSDFHTHIASASSYRVLADFIDLLLVSVRRHRSSAAKQPARWQSVIIEHDALLAALREHDPLRAEAAALEHVRSQATEVTGDHTAEGE